AFIGPALLVHAFLDMRGAKTGNCLYFSENIVQNISPMAKHVNNNTSVIFLAVVPGRPLGRNRIPFKNPVTKFPSYRKYLPKKSAFDQTFDFSQAWQPQFVLYHSVFHSCLFTQFEQLQSGSGICCHWLFAINMLSGFNRLSDGIRSTA